MLVLDHVDQYYGGSHILRDVSLEIAPGRVTALLGRNGVGKTTLLRAIMGLVPVAGGRLTFEGEDLTCAPTHRRARAGIGYVPQGREIFPRLTVQENLLMGMAGRSRGDALPPVTLNLFPALGSMLSRRGGDLSGGQQQQLAIARALAAGPKLLILDEPTEGIQPSIVKEIERAVRGLARYGQMAILLVEQYYEFARSLADHYLVMQRGEIVRRGQGSAMDADGVKALLWA
jgi:urea transport system ATP-binding protein